MTEFISPEVLAARVKKFDEFLASIGEQNLSSSWRSTAYRIWWAQQERLEGTNAPVSELVAAFDAVADHPAGVQIEVSRSMLKAVAARLRFLERERAGSTIENLEAKLASVKEEQAIDSRIATECRRQLEGLKAKLYDAELEVGRLRQLACERFQQLEAIDPKTRTVLGVGDGSGNLFVYGTSEAVHAARAFILRVEEQAKEIRRLEALLEEPKPMTVEVRLNTSNVLAALPKLERLVTAARKVHGHPGHTGAVQELIDAVEELEAST